MARGKSVTKLLLDSSQAALFAGIEIHNKPHISYRYSTSVILITNAWELALKAYIYKYVGKKRIYEGTNKHTITISKAMGIVRDDINRTMKNKFTPIYENLRCLNEYRCSNVHYFEEDLDPIIFMLLSKAVLNYDEFVKAYFKRDITKDDNLIILPVGMKLPFDPIDYLKQEYSNAHNDFVNDVILTVRTLKDEEISDSIVVGFDLYTSSVKKVSNADIIAAIDQINGEIKLSKDIRITSNPNAPEYRASDGMVLPYVYKEVISKIKEFRPDIKLGTKFHEIMREIKKDQRLCQTRYLDPNNQKGTKKQFYSEDVIQAIIEKYDQVHISSDQCVH